jgi:hypothetical protein
MVVFVAFTFTLSAAFSTFRFSVLAGSHLSIIMGLGRFGNGASLSIIILRGNGCDFFGMLIIFGSSGIGGFGGTSRKTSGAPAGLPSFCDFT